MNRSLDRPAAADRVVKFTYASGARPLDGYTIKRGIGRGGFGEVYYATSDGGKEVALKLIRRHLDVELRGVQQCMNLKHPNLLGLFDVRTDGNGDSWVVMEYVRGECLEQTLARHPQGLEPAEAMRWFHGLAAAVGYLHDRGIVHRDLKPGNIFNDDGVVKLGDYGLSKFISVSRRSGQTESIGTVHYMAPEIGNGRYGKEIDIYALGILLYEMLTGHVPFEGESVGEVLMKHLTAEPDVSRLAEPYRAAVKACLTKDPAQRPQSVAELVAMLPPPTNAPISPGPAMIFPSPVRETAPFQPRTESSTVQANEWSHVTRITLIALLIIFAPVLSTVVIGGGARMGFVTLILVGMGVWLMRSQRKAASLARSPASAQLMPTLAHGMTPIRESPLVVREEPALPPPPPKTRRENVTDLIGSLLLAALIVPVLATAGLLMSGTPPKLEQFAWLSLTTTIGSWFVLAAAKAWEGGRANDTARRRVGMMVAGLALGAFACEVDRYLGVNLGAVMPDTSPAHKAWLKHAYLPDGQPAILEYLALFGITMLVARWWLLADPQRRHRVNLWDLTKCVLTAFVVGVIWPFPLPWGLLVFAGIGLSVQLASPWHPRKPKPKF